MILCAKRWLAVPSGIFYPCSTMFSEMAGEFRPPHTLRVSARAQRVHLRVTPEEGLVVIAPLGFPQEEVLSLLRSQQAWVQRALARVAEDRQRIEASRRRPDQLDLRAVDRSWEIEWRHVGGTPLRVTPKGNDRLCIRGDIQDPAGWPKALRRWVQREGRRQLPPWLASHASSMGLSIGRVAIRCQKTRWGSCSRHGAISLNAQLLFLPRSLVSYVLHHELCHLIHPNHSVAFWKLLEQFEPDARRHRRELRRALPDVPIWMRPHAHRLMENRSEDA